MEAVILGAMFIQSGNMKWIGHVCRRMVFAVWEKGKRMYKELVEELRHYFADVPLVMEAADAIEKMTAEREWIDPKKELPSEAISLLTHDHLEYPCIFDCYGKREVRYFKFGDGHWWDGGIQMDNYVSAWRNRPKLPEEM